MAKDTILGFGEGGMASLAPSPGSASVWRCLSYPGGANESSGNLKIVVDSESKVFHMNLFKCQAPKCHYSDRKPVGGTLLRVL